MMTYGQLSANEEALQVFLEEVASKGAKDAKDGRLPDPVKALASVLDSYDMGPAIEGDTSPLIHGQAMTAYSWAYLAAVGG